MSNLPQKLVNRIDQKKRQLEKLRPLPKTALAKLQERFEVEMTYNSNAIEGNSLTLKETYLVINEGITIKGKPLKDHLEAKDHHEALEMVFELVDQKSKPTLSEHLIRSLHQLVVKKSDEEIAGKYRDTNVFIAGSSHVPPDALQAQVEMKKLLSWYSVNQSKIHPIELAAILHHKLVHIHPFIDGNGRTARLVMNISLMRSGYPLAVILKNDRKKYYRVLQTADEGKFSPLARFVAQTVERSLDIYLDTLSPRTKLSEKYLLLSKISPKTPYAAEYLNLLARQGKLEAHKLGRNWLTSKEAVQRYIDTRERKREI